MHIERSNRRSNRVNVRLVHFIKHCPPGSESLSKRKVKRKWNGDDVIQREGTEEFRNGAFFIAVFKHAIPTTCPPSITLDCHHFHTFVP